MKTKNLILLILAAVMMFIGIATQAQPNTMTISESQRLRQEKTALVEWIVAHTKARKKPISGVQARKIVDSVYEYSAEHQVDPLLVLAMMRNESGFESTAKSKQGAKGLMQVMPKYHREKISSRNPYDVVVSIDVGARVLREYLDSNNGKVKPALKKYSGGAKNYYGKISNTYKELSKYLVEHAFINEYPIAIVYSIDKPTIPATARTVVVASK